MELVIDGRFGWLMHDHNAVNTRLTNLENRYEIIQLWQSVSGTPGTIALPKTGGGSVATTKYTIQLDEYPAGVDALITKLDGVPKEEFAYTAAGVLVTVVLSGADNRTYTLSGAPIGYPVALIYFIKIKTIYAAEIDTTYILDRFTIDEYWSMTNMVNGDLTGLSSDRYVGTTVAFTVPRTYTLPLANSVSPGTEIIVADQFMTVTSTNTLSIARAGGDNINGAATSIIIKVAGGWRRFRSDGISKWSYDAGVLRTSDTNYLTLLYSISVNSIGNLGATPTIDFATAYIQTGTLSANITSMTLSNCPVNIPVRLRMTMANFTIAWDANIRWQNGVVPVHTATSGYIDEYIFVKQPTGNLIDGFYAPKYATT
jgi:hypothetical protein